MEIIYLLLIIELSLLLMVMVFTSFDFTCPSFITLVMFTLSTVSLIINGDNWNVNFDLVTFLVLTFGLTVMVTVELSAMYYYRKKNIINQKNTFKIVSFETEWVKGSIVKTFILILSVLMMLIYIREIFSIGRGLNLNNMISVIGAVKASEYHTSTIATLCLRIGYALSNLYAFIFCHNVIISHQKVKQNLYLIASAVCGIVSSFYSGSRGMLMGSMIAFGFYFIIFSRISHGWREIKIRKYLKYIVPAMVLFIGFFFFSRNAVKNREYTTGVFEYITYYLGNSQQLLNLSITNSYGAFPDIYSIPGAYTFQFFYNELDGIGIISLPEKISSRFLRLNLYSKGNVYTMFGEPYNDFGFFGMLIYVAVFYWIFSYFYYKYIRYWENTEKGKDVLLVFGSQYYLVFFTFYLAPTIWLKIQTLVTIIIILITYKFIRKYRIIIGKR